MSCATIRCGCELTSVLSRVKPDFRRFAMRNCAKRADTHSKRNQVLPQYVEFPLDRQAGYGTARVEARLGPVNVRRCRERCMEECCSPPPA